MILGLFVFLFFFWIDLKEMYFFYLFQSDNDWFVLWYVQNMDSWDLHDGVCVIVPPDPCC